VKKKILLVTLNAMVWVASKFMRLGQWMAQRAIIIALKHDLSHSTAPEPAPEPAPEQSKHEEEAEPVPSNLPPFRGEDGNPIQPYFDPLPEYDSLPEYDPLPEYVVFEAMFAKKYGKYGRCVMVVMGQPRSFSCKELYHLLDAISKDKEAHPTLRALYDTVMSVIIKRHGQPVDTKTLN